MTRKKFQLFLHSFELIPEVEIVALDEPKLSTSFLKIFEVSLVVTKNSNFRQPIAFDVVKQKNWIWIRV